MKLEHNSKFFKDLFLHAAKIACVVLVYFVVAKLGLYLATVNTNASPVWPATGFALFAVLIWGPWMAIGVFIGAFLANSATGIPLQAVIGISLGNSLEAFAGVWLFHLISPKTQRLGEHAKLINYIFVATVPTILSASIGVLSLYLTNVYSAEGLRSSWLTWWVGDTLGALILFPLAVRIYQRQFEIPLPSLKTAAQAFAAIAFTNVLCFLVFDVPAGAPFLFILFSSILLTALLLDSSWTYLISIGICIYSTLKTREGLGPFTGQIMNENLIHLQLFLAGIGITAIALGSLRQEGLKKSPVWALIFGWIMTGTLFYSFYVNGERKDLEYFNAKSEESEKILLSTFGDYSRLLESSAGFFAASDEVTREEWKEFTSRLKFEQQYAGIEGMGVARYVKDDRAERKLVLHERATGRPNFEVHKLAVSSPELQSKNALIRTVVTYLEPELKNQKALGLDTSSEKNRAEAMVRTRDSGKITITNQVNLVQDAQNRPGFGMMMPFYRKHAVVETVEQRREAFEGIIFAPVIVEKFVKLALNLSSGEVDVKVYFGSKEDPKNEVFSSAKVGHKTNFLKESSVVLGGLPVNLVWTPSEKFQPQSSLVASWIGFSGALICVFLTMLLSGLESLADRAQKIVEAKTAELSQSERLWRALTETSPVGIFITDENGTCTYINDTFAQIVDCDLSRALFIGWSSLIHAEDYPRVMNAWYEFIKTGEAFNCSYRSVVRPKREVYVHSQAVPLKNEEGKTIGFMGTVQDTTELQQKQFALVAASRMSSLGEMAGGVAHEINNPLAIISGNAHHLDVLLQQPEIDVQRARRYVQKIDLNVERIAKIIKGLRTIARDVPNDPLREVDANDIIQDTLELCRSRFRHHEIPLEVFSELSHDVKILARPEQIVQVLLNLLNNAFDAVQNADRKWVRVNILELKDKVQFEVLDSGHGMPEELQEKVFTAFFTTKEVGKGTGLGLSISRGLIDRNNGRLFIDDKSVHTKFVVELSISRTYVEKNPDC